MLDGQARFFHSSSPAIPLSRFASDSLQRESFATGEHMIYYLQHIDWRAVTLALLAYYFLPSLITSELLASLTDESSVPPHIGRPAASYFAFFYLILPPLMAGHFVARFARRLPLLSALVLTLLGWGLTTSSATVSAQALAAYAVLCMGLGIMGVKMQLKKQQA